MSLDNKTSETALITVSLRALACYDDAIKCDDNLAEYFLPSERKIPLKDKNTREIIKKSIPVGMYEYIIARTTYFDNIVKQSIEENIPQIVFLGAGYDSRPYRFSNLIIDTKIFELDTKPTQDRKISILNQSNININQNITFIPINFETDNLEIALINNGFDKSKKALFIWEGVTFYLSNKAVNNILSIIHNMSISESTLCFDFQTKVNDEELIKTNITDESIKFGVEYDKINSFVNSRGFKIIEHITAIDMENKYLTVDNKKIGNILPIMNFIYISIDEQKS